MTITQSGTVTRQYGNAGHTIEETATVNSTSFMANAQSTQFAAKIEQVGETYELTAGDAQAGKSAILITDFNGNITLRVNGEHYGTVTTDGLTINPE
jgi:hypothetical protein